MVRGKFSMKNIRISLDAYKIEYIRRFGIRKITAQGRLSIHGQSPLSRKVRLLGESYIAHYCFSLISLMMLFKKS